jgi:hypothetical protein
MFIYIKSIIVLCKNKRENKRILFYSIIFYSILDLKWREYSSNQSIRSTFDLPLFKNCTIPVLARFFLPQDLLYELAPRY